MTKIETSAEQSWLVIAQLGPPRRMTDEYAEVSTIVVAERATEGEAERERDRRNALNDGRWYFVMSTDDYHASEVIAE
jgi:hypothetical protein